MSKKGFEIAELSYLKPKQYEAYQKSLLEYWDVRNVSDTSFAEGKIEGKIETAQELKQLGIATNTIVAATGLTAEEVERL